MKLKHIDLLAETVDQDAREVNTKFSKSFVSFFFPVSGEAKSLVTEWVTFLTTAKGWGPSDPLFPATRVGLGVTRQFEVLGLERKHWTNATPIRKIFRDAFRSAGLPYFNPHSFRKTLATLAQDLCATPEALKAWSQNLGHEGVLTTLYSYGSVASGRQAQLMKELGRPRASSGQFSGQELSEVLAEALTLVARKSHATS
jgi:integrase